MEISKFTNELKFLFENKKEFSGKNINDTQLFDYKDGEYEFDESLLQKDGFIEKLFSNEKNALTKEQLGALYDAVASLDNKEGMSKEEIEILASQANAFDQIDPNGKTINELDIAAFLESLEEEENVEDEICETCPDDCACGCKDPKIFNSTETFSTVFKDDDRIKTDEDGQKYVNVEPLGSGEDSANDCLPKIIKNSYDLDAMGIELYSEEYYELEKAVMDANPEIYGTEDGGGRDRMFDGERNSAILYEGDKIVLPEFDYEKKFECECDHSPHEENSEITTDETPETIPEGTTETIPEDNTETIPENTTETIPDNTTEDEPSDEIKDETGDSGVTDVTAPDYPQASDIPAVEPDIDISDDTPQIGEDISGNETDNDVTDDTPQVGEDISGNETDNDVTDDTPQIGEDISGNETDNDVTDDTPQIGEDISENETDNDVTDDTPQEDDDIPKNETDDKPISCEPAPTEEIVEEDNPELL